jgi:hypothetical protein
VQIDRTVAKRHYRVFVMQAGDGSAFVQAGRRERGCLAPLALIHSPISSFTDRLRHHIMHTRYIAFKDCSKLYAILYKVHLEVYAWYISRIHRHGPRNVPKLEPMDDVARPTNKAAERDTW